MLTVKGFLSLDSLKNNGADTTAIFGEITSYCRTFTKDLKEYSSPTYPGLEMLVFSSKDNGVAGVFTVGQQTKLLEISNYIYSLGTVITANFRPQDVVANIAGTYGEQISEVTIGNLQSDGYRRLPEFVAFRLTLPNETDIAVKFWLRNASFEAQYDEYEIIVVPPVDSLDSLVLGATQVQALADARSIDQSLELIDTAKAKNPATVTVATTVRWYNAAQVGNFIKLTWYAVVYGPTGNTTDNINAAIVDYVHSHSTESDDVWKVIFPDLFRNTYFAVLPRWDTYAIPNRTSIAGIYSPILDMQEAKNFAFTKLPQLSQAQLDVGTQVTFHPYRSLALVVVGGPDNRESLFKLSLVVPDYIAVSSTSEDFNRQKELTKQWVLMMDELLQAAESLTLSLVVPPGMRAFTFMGMVCVSKKLDGIEYIVAAKLNYGSV